MKFTLGNLHTISHIYYLFLDNSYNEVLVSKRVTLHRLSIHSELLELFQDETILDYDLKVTLIDPRGKEEKGVGVGLMKEVLCIFLQNLYQQTQMVVKKKFL